MRLPPPSLLLALVACALSSFAAPVLAQMEAEPSAQELHIARSLFEEGLRYVDEKSWDEAADRFARVLEIRWSPVVAYNLGSARLRQGKAVMAAEHFRRLLREPDMEESVRKAATQLLSEAESIMGRMSVRIEGPSEGLQVRVDGGDWPSVAMGVAVPVDPGAHRVQLLEAGEVVDDREVSITPQKTLELTFDRTPAEPIAAVPAPANVAEQAPARDPDPLFMAEAPMDEQADDDGGNLQWWLWGGVGVAVVGTVVGVLLATAGGDDPSPVDADLGTIEGTVR